MLVPNIGLIFLKQFEKRLKSYQGGKTFFALLSLSEAKRCSRYTLEKSKKIIKTSTESQLKVD